MHNWTRPGSSKQFSFHLKREGRGRLSVKRMIPFAIFALMSLTGCTKQKWYYNDNVPPNEQQAAYNNDLKYCNAVASGTVSMPELGPKNEYTHGTARVYNSSTGYSTINYDSQTTTGGDFTSGLIQGMNFGNAAFRRNDVAQACMYRLGWREIPEGYKAPSSNTADSLIQRYPNMAGNNGRCQGSCRFFSSL